MQTPSPATRRADTCTARPKPRAWPYPPEASDAADHVTYWLHAWMRAVAQNRELWEYITTRGGAKAFPPGTRRRDAFFSALGAQQRDADNALKELKGLGGLLFAWAGTTKLEGGAA